MKPGYLEAVARSGVMAKLAAFSPAIAGTPPLGLDLPGSDIDILCHAPDTRVFADAIWNAFRDLPGFTMRQWRGGDRAVIAGFIAHGWEFEIFGHPLPVTQQAGWRHFEVERRLLALGGDVLRAKVMELREHGLKTEPAFATVLGLAGDPYQALFELGDEPDSVLLRLLAPIVPS